MSARLTDRDRRLARLLVEHRVLTTAQITAAAFTHPGTARNRLRQLRELGFLDAFTHHPRSGPSVGRRVTCWVPGLLAARYVALADGRPVPTPRAVRQAQDRVLANPQLDHLLGVNQFFTDLIAHSRAHPCGRLVRWWSAERAANAYAGRIHPDGHGIWQPRPTPAGEPTDEHHIADIGRTDRTQDKAIEVGGNSIGIGIDVGIDMNVGIDADVGFGGFWFEHDTGSEPLTRVVAKLVAYQRLQDAGGPTCPVLFQLPTRQREDNLHRLLSQQSQPARVQVATAVHGGPSPAGGDSQSVPATWRRAFEADSVVLPPCKPCGGPDVGQAQASAGQAQPVEPRRDCPR